MPSKDTMDALLTALKAQVDQGRIQAYGISMSSSVKSSTIERIIESGAIQFLEFPFNLMDQQSSSLFQLASQHNIATINSSPSYYTQKGHLHRLAEVRSHKDRDLAKLVKEAFDLAVHLEIINPIFKDSVQVEQLRKNPDIIGSLRWAHMLVYDRNKYEKLSNYWSWRKIMSTRIKPQVNDAILAVFSNHIMNTWGGGYKKAMASLFDLYTKSLESDIFTQQKHLSASITDAATASNLSDSFTSLPLIHKANVISRHHADISIEHFTDIDEARSVLVNAPSTLAASDIPLVNQFLDKLGKASK
eukprot:gene4045-4687_t